MTIVVEVSKTFYRTLHLPNTNDQMARQIRGIVLGSAIEISRFFATVNCSGYLIHKDDLSLKMSIHVNISITWLSQISSITRFSTVGYLQKYESDQFPDSLTAKLGRALHSVIAGSWVRVPFQLDHLTYHSTV